MVKLIRHWLSNTRGAVAVEFILISPILILMLIAGFEAGRYVMIMNKVQSTAFTLANVIAQTPPATVLNEGDGGRLDQDNLINILNGVDTLMQPFDAPNNQVAAIATSIQRQGGGGNLIRWQGSVGSAFDGAVSVVNGSPAGPGQTRCAGQGSFDGAGEVISDLQILQPNENMLVLEVFFRYQPAFLDVLTNVGTPFTPRTIIKRVYFYNRLGQTLYLPPDCPIPDPGDTGI